MAFKGITINTAPETAAHIYAQDDAAIYQGIFGSDGVVNIGNKFKATVQSNTKVRVSDGVLVVGGHVGRTPSGEYNDLTIQNGASGYKRNDIIYAKFLTSGSTDTLALNVKKGTATTGTPADPAMTQNNLYTGGTTREYPLWRVKLEGLSITKVEQMFKVIPTIPELEAKYNALNTDLGNYFALGNDNHPWGSWPNQSIASGAWATNTGKIADGTVTGAYNVNITKDGAYLVVATATFATSAAGTIRGIRLIHNETTHQPEELYPSSSNTTTVRIVRSIYLHSGDTLRIGLYQNSGGALSASYISLNAFRLLD